MATLKKLDVPDMPLQPRQQLAGGFFKLFSQRLLCDLLSARFNAGRQDGELVVAHSLTQSFDAAQGFLVVGAIYGVQDVFSACEEG
jgi:hypothetical protein